MSLACHTLDSSNSMLPNFLQEEAWLIPLHSLIFPLHIPLEIQERGESEKHIKFSKDAGAGI
ncbi:MAG: hypothetical protein QW412_01740 [Candidatus Aenigmatarchaeota archaeon]